jgi:hypothetical protein
MLRSYKFKNHGIIICGLSSGWIAANPEDRQKEVVEKNEKSMPAVTCIFPFVP